MAEKFVLGWRLAKGSQGIRRDLGGMPAMAEVSTMY